MQNSNSHHVVPQGGKWRVMRSGASRASGIFETQKEAVTLAKKLAKTHGAVLYIHGEDGLIRERNSYGKDSHPPKG